MKTKRIVVYKVSTGNSQPEFVAALSELNGDLSTQIFNTGLDLFPKLESKDLNIFIHGNTYVLGHVTRDDGFITGVKPLLNAFCHIVDEYPNGNTEYKDFTIVRTGKIGTTNEYIFNIMTTDAMANAALKVAVPEFGTLAEALKYIDETGITVEYVE